MAWVINRIRAWANELKYWEGLALEKIARSAVLSEQDKLELVQEFIQDAGLTRAVADRSPLSFPTGGPEQPSSPDARLERLFNLSDVNALPVGQEIRFGPQITLIFGGNGAGKTGYARPLACAAFARGERAVLPNATQNPPVSSPRADIEVRSGGRTQVVTWVSGRNCPELAGFYVFDANSLSAHLTRANTLAFAPSSLELLTKLAEMTDEIRQRLKGMIAEREVPHKLGSFFEGHSEVAEAIGGLGAQTDLVALCELAKLSPEESAEMEVLEREIIELKSRETAKYIEIRQQGVVDLERLLSFVGQAEEALTEPAEKVGSKLIRELKAARENAQRSGTDQFKLEALRQVGSESWIQFILAAKRLGDAESARGEPYPGRGDHCLFCQQPLSDEALAVIQKIWAFLESDAQEQMRAALRACERKIRDLSGLNLRYFEADSAARRLLASELPALVPSIEAQLDAFRERRNMLIASLESGETRPLPPPITVDLTDVRTVVRNRKDQISELEASDTGERLKRHEESLRVLRHRQTLGQHMGEIAAWVDQRRWASKARACLGTTRHITEKYNELFEELVTARYAELFQETLARFKAHVHLTIETYGQKGDRLRRISLSPAVFPSRYSVEQILSDGEKTAVAMADFLTEADLDGSSSGIVLDDPITSLDNEWKGVLAECLAERAQERQVVVFTHDLAFAYYLNEHAQKLGVGVVTHWIREENGRPGFVYVDNSPLCERDFKSADRARRFYSQAKGAGPEAQESLLQQGFGALRTSYEALVIFELFNNVVGRFDERIRFDALKDVRFDPQDVTEIVERMAGLSRHIEGHLHSDAFRAVKPTPELLLAEIEAFERVRERVRALKKPQTQPKPSRADAPLSADGKS